MTSAKWGKPLLAAAIVLASSACSTAPEPKSTASEPAPKPPAAAITQFYASPGIVGKGGRSLICYGVEAAVKVWIEPAVEEIAPSLARCIEVKPAATTTYKLIAANRAGEEVSQSITLTVDPKAAAGAGAPAAETPRGEGMILFFTAIQNKVPKGTPVTFCYGVKDAISVSISPAVQTLVPSERMCFQTRPEASGQYVLTATSATGAKNTRIVRISIE